MFRRADNAERREANFQRIKGVSGMKALLNEDRIGHLTGEHGYTLLEVLFAISIFMVGILAIGSMQASALKGNSVASGVTQAVEIAQRQIEEIMSIEYDPASPAAELTPGSTTTLEETIFGNTYTVTRVVAAHPSIANAITIQVRVAWRDYGVNKEIVYDMLRTEMI
jgi:Tfp pilus assembly protein PilV